MSYGQTVYFFFLQNGATKKYRLFFDNNPGDTNAYQGYIKTMQIKIQPSKVVIFSEVYNENVIESDMEAPFQIRGNISNSTINSKGVGYLRHFKGLNSNTIFLDGHVELLKYQALSDALKAYVSEN